MALGVFGQLVVTAADADLLGAIDAALAPNGLMTRGATDDGNGGTVVLVGHAGSSIWPHFQAWRDSAPEAAGANPLDGWSRWVLEPVAARFGAKAGFPSDRPYLPFQRWARAAEGLRPSPLGLLIHPVYGLWHAYRGALLFATTIAPAPQAPPQYPCDSCRDRPCLSGCPVDAFDGAGFDADACRRYLPTGEGASCLHVGCRARLACPVGRAYAYRPEQQHFHLAAFAGVSSH